LEARQPAIVEAITKDWRSAPVGPRAQALCAYAEKLTRAPGSMSDFDLAPLREAGLDDAAILDLAQVTGYFNYINRIASGLGVDLEDFMEASTTFRTTGPHCRPDAL
jgi:uncharacterized peroxidase-related enzyme